MSKLKIQIKSRFTGSVLFEYESENNTVKKTVGEAVKSGVDLSGADLSGAYLSGAYLSGADLSGANLDTFKNDIWAILIRSNEVSYLLKALKEGRVNGKVYEGDCACLVGTIANSKGCKYTDMEKMNGLIPNSFRPAEIWFRMIKKDDTPETSNVVKKTVEWIEEFESLLNTKLQSA